MTNDIKEDLRVLEESLWRAATRFDDVLMQDVFAQDMVEFGRSGRVYARDDLFIGDQATSEIAATLPLAEFEARIITPNVVLVTYTSEVVYGNETERANRSSLWSKIDGAWRLRFHQGTPIA